ncbi:MAG: hypothetical protein ABJO67_00870 [Pseudoruegeria sp.]
MKISRRALIVGGASAYAWSSRKANAKTPTKGGSGGRLIEVSSLEDSGAGTLRAALSAIGPRRIVFKVAGEIWSRDTLSVYQPHVTIEGETAPSPGITILGDRIRIRANDVVFRHIRLRVGALQGSAPNNRDGFTIDGSLDGRKPIHGVLIENCSVSWAVDELLQIWGENSSQIVVRNCIFAEALNHSTHPKGAHSMGPIIGPLTKGIVFERNLLAHNSARNPVVSGGAEAIVVNNLVYNPGYYGIHFYPWAATPRPTLAAVIGNVVIAGPNTKNNLLALADGLNPGSRIYYRDNIAIGVNAFDENELLRKGHGVGTSPFVVHPPLSLVPIDDILPSRKVYDHLLEHAGATPKTRDPIDRRIISEVRNRTGSIRDWPQDPRLDPNSNLRAR